jgi:hypothetical protein
MVLTLVAIAVLWQREPRSMDLWLMVVMWVWLFDIALAAVLGSSRFDLGFYARRIFGLFAASFLLVTFFLEATKLQARAAQAAIVAEQRLAAQARSRRQPELMAKRTGDRRLSFTAKILLAIRHSWTLARWMRKRANRLRNCYPTS